MRLIDADELKKECRSVPDPRGRYAELRIIEDYEIDDVPTIFNTDNATNGDVIKVIFPDAEIHLDGNDIFIHHMGFWIKCNIRWWNALYK